ncbi:YbaK/EbsC family protein [Marinomonas sp.]|uniref:YbaK/EbsC family protein n=1 Tax=Marinomonas sp. TaxID=1904862 RepID=UPI003BABCF6C
MQDVMYQIEVAKDITQLEQLLQCEQVAEKVKRHFLVVVSDEKQINLNFLSECLDVKRLSFASPQRLEKYLDTAPGSVSILGVVNDPEGLVEVIIDQDVWQSETLQCHPLVNTSTLVMKLSDLAT